MGEARKVGNSHETYDFVAHDRVLYDIHVAIIDTLTYYDTFFVIHTFYE